MKPKACDIVSNSMVEASCGAQCLLSEMRRCVKIKLREDEDAHI